MRVTYKGHDFDCREVSRYEYVDNITHYKRYGFQVTTINGYKIFSHEEAVTPGKTIYMPDGSERVEAPEPNKVLLALDLIENQLKSSDGRNANLDAIIKVLDLGPKGDA